MPRTHVRRRAVLLVGLLLPLATPAPAQTPPTLHAVRLTSPLEIDGKLDEPLYRDVATFTNFVQMEPEEGAPATEQTEVWIAFDRDNVYVSFRCWESRPDRVVAKEMRRDNGTVWSGDDNVGFLLDTFYDRRNGFMFTVNAVGGRNDGQMVNERQYNGDWNTVWDFRVNRFDGGWVVETAIPFKSLRYAPGDDQVWGFNAIRTNRWKNELSFLTPVPKALGAQGLQRASLAARLVGISAPSGSKNLEIKPYVISNTTGQAVAGRPVVNESTADAGLDVKYGLTQNLTTDFTYNTDFAQVEADQQQVNLTRFSLFFPEKREFFLENQGTFTFGTTTPGNRSDTPILFYSRRIGLENGRSVPIRGGGRLTGRIGSYSIGLFNIQTAADEIARAPATNFSVVRMKRDILRRSSVGVLLTGREATQDGAGRNVAYGIDGMFAFFQNVAVNTYWARTAGRHAVRGGTRGDSTSYRAQFEYAGDRYGLQMERILVGAAFDPGVGYVRRTNMLRSFGQARFSPRPRANRTVRKYSWTGSIDYIEDGEGQLETRAHEAEFAIEFQNSDRFNVTYENTYEFLPSPFRIAPRVTLPVGGYEFDNVRVGFNRGPRQRISGNVSAEHGTFYNGQKTTLEVTGGRINFVPQFSAEPTYSVNWVQLHEGEFTRQLIGSRVTLTPTPFMFVSALLQYASESRLLSSNVRFRWEYRPGSELFVVYNDERDTLGRRFPDLKNRAFIVKVNRLLRF